MMHRLAVCAACLLVLAPRLVPALGLGAIEARSALNAPLDARIPLTRVRSEDLEGLKVALGSPAQFELAGIARLPVLESFEFSVVEQDGGGYIHVRTDEPIGEPSLTFLVEVDWPRGRTVRGYRLYLASAAAGAGGTPASGQAAPEAKREPGTGAPVSAPASPPASPPASGDATMTVRPSDPNRVASPPALPPAPGGVGYGPVRASDTLWSIAARVRSDDSVSVQRMMLALLEANPEAFAIRNVNALKAGVILRIPGRDELGSDDRTAAIAELKRQHAAWAQYRESVRAAPAPSAPVPSAPVPSAPVPSAPAPSAPSPRDTEPEPRDTEPEPRGRIEVISPETTVNTAAGKEDADIQALRNELALAVEEADASRRENAELKFRLAEIEGQIKELIRLVALKSEEIAALQTELRTMAAMRSRSAPPEGEPRPASPEGESKSMPFGLGALPVNPVFLVGGAGLLLILLGVVALLRRRSSAGGHDAHGPAGPLSSGEDDLLLELEAVAADLTDETDDPQGRRSRAAPAAGRAGGMEPEAVRSDVVRSEPESLAERRIAELRQDAPETRSALPEEPATDDGQDYDAAIRRREPALPVEPAADDDKADISFDIDTLVRDDSDIGDFADSDAGRKGDSTAPAGDPDLHFSHRETRAVGSAAPAPTTDAGRPADLVHDIPDDRREDVALVASGSEASVDTGPRAPGAARPDSGRKPVATADEHVDPGPGPDGNDGDPAETPRTMVDDRADHAGIRAISTEDFSGDEVQTKIDIAQVYMEMGDTDGARGFLEAVLAEGDADQRNTAREMLAKLA